MLRAVAGMAAVLAASEARAQSVAPAPLPEQPAAASAPVPLDEADVAVVFTVRAAGCGSTDRREPQ